MKITDFGYIQLTIDGKFDIVSLEKKGKVLDTLENIDHLKMHGNLVNLKENGYG